MQMSIRYENIKFKEELRKKEDRELLVAERTATNAKKRIQIILKFAFCIPFLLGLVGIILHFSLNFNTISATPWVKVLYLMGALLCVFSTIDTMCQKFNFIIGRCIKNISEKRFDSVYADCIKRMQEST